MHNSDETIVVSVDGPAASGKSTVSRGVARQLGFIYCDSGSLYRAVAWKMLENGADTDSEDAVAEVLADSEWEMYIEEKAMRFSIDGTDPGDAIRSSMVSDSVSAVAKMPRVREFVVGKLRAMTSCGNLVMEGRDIGTVVFPDARFKYYLDASPEERARRRHSEYQLANEGGQIEQVYRSLQRRDQTDSSRKIAPLQIPENALVIDSTKLGQQEVIELIVLDIRSKLETA